MFETPHDEDAGIFDMTEDHEFYCKMWKAVNDLIQDTFHLPKEKLAEMGVKTVDTIHPDLVEFRRELDVLFEKAEPLRQYQQLCAEIREDAKKLAEKMRSRIKDHPEMCDSNCPESDYCPQQVNGECPVIKHDYSGLWWGYNSFCDLRRLVPNLDLPY